MKTHARMILEAAERSGLLRDVAQFIWFTQQLKEAAPASCVLCLLRDDLTEVFEEAWAA